MIRTNTWNSPNSLEQLLGFKLDCPRCRARNPKYVVVDGIITIKCQHCGLELLIKIKSLVNYTGDSHSI